MGYYGSMKMKRKDLDEVNDDFSDFSLSSPARKIRRLDAELPPIMEEELPEIPLAFAQSGGGEAPVLVMEELPPHVPMNEERAIVLFKPMMNTPLLHSPSNFSVSVDSDIISSFQNFWSCQSNHLRPQEDEATQDKNSVPAKENLAVVPWVPFEVPQTLSTEKSPQSEASKLMEAEDMEATTMDIESNDAGLMQPNEFGGLRGASDGLLQHCMTPQLLQNMTTIHWYR